MATAWVEVPVSTRTEFVYTLLDVDDYIQLAGRGLSLGSHGYPQLWDRPTVKVLHRWILGLPKGRELVGDHINHNPLDNRRGNLRVLTPSESNMNRHVLPVNGEFGVRRARNGKWAARGYWMGKQKQIGTFGTQEAAMAAAREWQQRVRPEAEALRPEVAR